MRPWQEDPGFKTSPKYKAKPWLKKFFGETCVAGSKVKEKVKARTESQLTGRVQGPDLALQKVNASVNKKPNRADKLAQQAKVLAASSDVLSLIPGPIL